MKNNTYSLLSEIREHLREEKVSAHMPGHKYKKLFKDNLWTLDSTEIHGLDNLHDAKGMIKRAEQFISTVYGSRESKILIGGSTAGIMSTISASKNKLLVPRNAHKSVFNAIRLNGFDFITYNKINEIEGIIDADDSIKTLLITSPSYAGKINDLKNLLSGVKKKGILIIADEAHGAHLEFINMKRLSCINMGADVVIQSAHKNLPALTGAAMVHFCNDDRAYINTVKYYLTVFQTSSPSYPIIVSTAEAVKYMDDNRTSILKVIDIIKNIKSKKLKPYIDEEDENDPFKIFILAGRLGLNGYDLDKKLRDSGIFSEMVNEKGVLLYLSCFNTKEEINYIADRITEVDSKTIISNNLNSLPDFSTVYSEKKLLNCDPIEIELDRAEGYISLDTITIYPPACPVIIRGELLTREIIANAMTLIEKSTDITGMTNYNDRIISACIIEENE